MRAAAEKAPPAVSRNLCECRDSRPADAASASGAPRTRTWNRRFWRPVPLPSLERFRADYGPCAPVNAPAIRLRFTSAGSTGITAWVEARARNRRRDPGSRPRSDRGLRAGPESSRLRKRCRRRARSSHSSSPARPLPRRRSRRRACACPTGTRSAGTAAGAPLKADARYGVGGLSGGVRGRYRPMPRQ
jgi:hypothetical protein